jgi:uncharacterized membrane protein
MSKTGSAQLGAVPTWARVVTFTLSLMGLGISAYLSYTHFYPGALVCSPNGIINCALVTTSRQSEILGVPVAMLGAFQYLVMAGLCSPWGWRSPSYRLAQLRLLMGAVGMAFVLWLVSAELLIIDHICLWCTGVHLVTFALFVVLFRVAPQQLGWGQNKAE